MHACLVLHGVDLGLAVDHVIVQLPRNVDGLAKMLSRVVDQVLDVVVHQVIQVVCVREWLGLIVSDCALEWLGHVVMVLFLIVHALWSVSRFLGVVLFGRHHEIGISHEKEVSLFDHRHKIGISHELPLPVANL